MAALGRSSRALDQAKKLLNSFWDRMESDAPIEISDERKIQFLVSMSIYGRAQVTELDFGTTFGSDAQTIRGFRNFTSQLTAEGYLESGLTHTGSEFFRLSNEGRDLVKEHESNGPLLGLKTSDIVDLSLIHI